MSFLKVAVFSNVDNLLTYSAPGAGGEKTGCRVVVPLGTKTTTGLVIETHEKPDIPADKIKSIRSFLDDTPVISHELIKLGLWAADYYVTAPGIMFSTMLAPLYKVVSKKRVRLIDENTELSGRQMDVAEFLKDRDNNEAGFGEMEKNLKISGLHAVIAAMEKKGIVAVEEKQASKGIKKKKLKPDTGRGAVFEAIKLNPFQQEAFSKISTAIIAAKYRTFLLFGATGSGKTEVYIRAARETVALGKKVLVLVPEIFLTPQVTERFENAFGERTAIYHSGLKPAERLHEWERMKNSEVDVVVGTRSAVFAPFSNVGLIIVDEEFDSSYKQENDPRYSARDCAVYRATLNDAVVILGSATPSAESYHNATSGKYEMLRLPERVSKRAMPEIEVVDLKIDANSSNGLFLSNSLIKGMQDALDTGGQVILFNTRRGYSSYNFCMSCGTVEKCVNCDIPLVYHKHGNKLKCHYCDYQKPPALICPVCKKPIAYKGAGTQRVEDVIEKFFPDKRIVRVDMDSMKDKSEYFNLYNKIRNKEIDIMIGTQMITKGFDFPEVTFVGVVSIDTVLNLPDFRAEERVFELLMQVAGRTGRGDKPGKVVIQTFNPQNDAIEMTRTYQTEKFYAQQLNLRREFDYPPFGKIMQIVISNENEAAAAKEADVVEKIIQKAVLENRMKMISILGPAEAPLFRIRNKYRMSIILKSKNSRSLNIIGRVVKKEARGIDISVVVDPVNTL
jgi:primosomal protein N' (replication factor Y)